MPPIERPRSEAELAVAIDDVRASPRDLGTIELLVVRPAKYAREVLDRGELDVAAGLVGDNWATRPSKPGKPNRNSQLTLMNIRAVRAVADRVEWPLAGDNLYVDLDLSPENLPPGTRLIAGAALLEITAEPHLGCVKFTKRFGSAATKWVNSPVGRALNLRGVNARVITGGAIRRGDSIKKA